MATVTIVSSSAPSYIEENAQPFVSWRNLLAEGTITDAALPTVGPRQNAVSVDTVSQWKPTGSATLRAAIAETASIAFFARHTMGSNSRTLKIQYDDAGWVDLVTITPTDDQPFGVIFPDRTPSGWGVEVSGACEIGVAWIGPRLVIPGGVVPDYTPLSGARRVDIQAGLGRTGGFLGQRRLGVSAELTAQLMPLERTFVDSDMAGFRSAYTEGKPFVWSPSPGVFDEIAYCVNTAGQFGHSIRAGGDLCNLTLNMAAYCEP